MIITMIIVAIRVIIYTTTNDCNGINDSNCNDNDSDNSYY